MLQNGYGADKINQMKAGANYLQADGNRKSKELRITRQIKTVQTIFINFFLFILIFNF